MTAVAPTLQAFFTQRLAQQRNASPHTIIAYRDTVRLLLRYAQRCTGKEPSMLDFADLDATLVAGFLEHLEAERHNSVRTRNTRLSAIHSFYRYASYREPAHAELIARVLAIPEKRARRRVVSFLTHAEIDALLAAPDRQTWTGRRDHALLTTMAQTGLRVAEVRQLRARDLNLDAGPYVQVTGKGRKERCTPLVGHTVATLRAWLDERQGNPDDPLFPTRTGRILSYDAIADLVAKHAATAQQSCPTLANKRVTPHTMRHSCAMELLNNRVDIAVIALWLGHERVQTTQVYLHGDLTIKQRALDRVAPRGTPPGRYRPPDALLAFLEGL
ncbi:MAG TPA: tyrosine-type recombinase/integrase [Acidimicrobiales bacterium]|nr:tyrosine-type recombinase/integrase [Acidimicrobiales bacterium]